MAACLARFSQHLPGEARDRPVITALRLPAVLIVLSKYTSFLKKWGARRPVPRTDSPLTHFASRRGEKSGLGFRGLDTPIGREVLVKSAHEIPVEMRLGARLGVTPQRFFDKGVDADVRDDGDGSTAVRWNTAG